MNASGDRAWDVLPGGWDGLSWPARPRKCRALEGTRPGASGRKRSAETGVWVLLGSSQGRGVWPGIHWLPCGGCHWSQERAWVSQGRRTATLAWAGPLSGEGEGSALVFTPRSAAGRCKQTPGRGRAGPLRFHPGPGPLAAPRLHAPPSP